MDISLSITFEGKTFQSRFQAASIVIGRSGGADPVDLDLSNDIRVSRRHARISWENERFWIEDLGSRHGTELNGRQIKGTGNIHLRSPTQFSWETRRFDSTRLQLKRLNLVQRQPAPAFTIRNGAGRIRMEGKPAPKVCWKLYANCRCVWLLKQNSITYARSPSTLWRS
jgi:pSer/pThr/pTyr-binding forkhead associated (FHA) protein